ncbi:MAG: NADH-quinone oxidoreductase subunit L [Candidatus Brocadiia bacterium]
MNAETAMHLAVTVPFAAGLLCILMPRRVSLFHKVLAILTCAAVLSGTVVLYGMEDVVKAPEWAGERVLLGLDGLSSMILVAAAGFSFLMVLYSVGFLSDEEVNPRPFYANILWAVGCACATILARDLLVLLFFWGLMGIPFFLLINLGPKDPGAAAKKTLIVLGGSDSLLILGIAIIPMLSGSFDILQDPLPLQGISVVACLCLAVAAFAKAGAMPFHSWVPDAAEKAPVPAVALLPASLDKLLGIYLFARICLDMFRINDEMRSLFMLVGAFTVMAAVMAALQQHNLRRLLGYHAVSQVGYMVLGIASGTALGVVGGLFHMLNNAIYKSCLFLGAGSAEKRSGTGELDEMGGMARAMPVTFVCFLIAALAISGVPPLNGFVSKWMIYGGLVDQAGEGGYLWVIGLIAAMFGSALTLASFVKVLHAVFLGRSREGASHEGPLPNTAMVLPMVVLALVCVAFGVMAFVLPVQNILLPAVPEALRPEMAGAAWDPGLGTILLVVALLLGAGVYLLGRGFKVREDESYMGGEIGERAAPYRFSGVDFYQTISSKVPSLKTLYKDAEEGWYDIYRLGQRFMEWIAVPLKSFHSGLLLTYVAWCVLGLIGLLWLFLH